VVVAIEVGGVTGGAVAAVAVIDRGVTVAIGADNAGAVDVGVTGETVVLVDGGDRIAGVAVAAESGRSDGRAVVVAMGAGEVISAMTDDTR